MELTRRFLLRSAGAGLGLGALGIRAGWSATTLRLGPMELTTLSDGYLVQPASFVLAELPEEDYLPILERYGISSEGFRPECNITLLRDGERVVLFDAGSGSGFVPTAGELPQALEAIGLDPAEVTHVIFTHGHADHLWGILDDFDEPFFPEAQHMMGRAEFDFWFDPDTVNRVPENRTGMAVGAKRRLDLMGDAFTLFEDGDEILPGVAARMTAGHTPGHMSFELRAGSQSVMILGDVVTNHHLNFERPDLPSAPDQDKQMAAATRRRLLDRLAAEQMPLIGFHLPGGGFGRVERQGSGFRLVPAEA